MVDVFDDITTKQNAFEPNNLQFQYFSQHQETLISDFQKYPSKFLNNQTIVTRF